MAWRAAVRSSVCRVSLVAFCRPGVRWNHGPWRQAYGMRWRDEFRYERGEPAAAGDDVAHALRRRGMHGFALHFFKLRRACPPRTATTSASLPRPSPACSIQNAGPWLHGWQPPKSCEPIFSARCSRHLEQELRQRPRRKVWAATGTRPSRRRVAHSRTTCDSPRTGQRQDGTTPRAEGL